MDNRLTYHIVDHIDCVFEEAGNQFSALRKISWGDSDKSYLEVRRWRNQADGTEFPAKGMTFLTEEGPGELANQIMKLGLGNTKQYLETLSEREDFRKSLNTVLGKEDENYDESAGELSDNFFDPNELLDIVNS
jgi:hypothetical protein